MGGYFSGTGDTAGTSTAYGIYATATGADTNYGIYSEAGRNYFAENTGIGLTSFGTSAAKVLGIASGTAPTTSPADAAQLYVADHNGQAGYARLHQRPENVTYTPASPVALLSELEMYKNPLAFAQGINMTYASTGSSGIAVANDSDIVPALNNFTWRWKGSLPDWTPSAVAYFWYQYQDAPHQFQYYLSTTGYITIRILSGALDWTITSTIPNTFVDGTEHEIVVVITRETASTAGSAVFYADGYQLGASVAITAASPVSITNTGTAYTMGTAGARYASINKDVTFFNRALTAAGVLSLYRNGIDYADKWGSQTSIITGNDSTFAGASNWANVDIAAFDSTGDLTITANAAGQYCTLPVANATTVAGKKYRLVYDVANLVSTWTIKDFGGTQTIDTIDAAGTGQSIEFTASTTGGIRIVSVANYSSADIDNVYLYPIGATLALESEGIQRDAWKDSSTNGLNASYPASGYSFLRPIRTDSAEGLLSVTTVSFAADADTTLYTVPAGKRLVLTKAILVVGADAGTSVISIGADGAETDWLPNNTLSAIDAANDAAILQPVPNTTPVLVKSYAGGTVIQAKVSSHAGGATNSLSLFGYLY
jgi:hypothetical protein